MNIKNRFSKLLPIFAAAVLCITTVTAAAEDKTDIKTASINNYNIEVLEEESEDTPDIPEPTEAPTEAPKPTEPTKPADKTTAAPIKPTTPAPTAPQKPTVPQRPNATVPNRPNAPVLPGNAEPNVTDGSQTTVEETSTDKSSNLFTTVENTYITYTAPDLSLSDAQANARRRNSIKQVAAAAGVGLTAAAILVIKLLYDRRKALSEDY